MGTRKVEACLVSPNMPKHFNEQEIGNTQTKLNGITKLVKPKVLSLEITEFCSLRRFPTLLARAARRAADSSRSKKKLQAARASRGATLY